MAEVASQQMQEDQDLSEGQSVLEKQSSSEDQEQSSEEFERPRKRQRTNDNLKNFIDLSNSQQSVEEILSSHSGTISMKFKTQKEKYIKYFGMEELLEELRIEDPGCILQVQKKQSNMQSAYFLILVDNSDEKRVMDIKTAIELRTQIVSQRISIPLEEFQKDKKLNFNFIQERANLSKCDIHISEKISIFGQEITLKALELHKQLLKDFKDEIEDLTFLRKTIINVFEVLESKKFERYMQYCYLSTRKHVLVDLLQDVIVDEIIYLPEKQKILVVTMEKNFIKVSSLIEMLKARLFFIETEIVLKLNIFKEVYRSELLLIEKQYNVSIRQKNEDLPDNESSDEDVNTSEKEQERLTPLFMIGSKSDVEDCLNLLQNSSDFHCVVKRIILPQHVKDQIVNNEESIKNLRQEYQVQISIENDFITLTGNHQYFNKVIEELKLINVPKTVSQFEQRIVKIPQSSYQRLISKIFKTVFGIKELEDVLLVRIKFENMKFILEGPPSYLDFAVSKLKDWIQTYQQRIRVEIIDDKIMNKLISNIGKEKLCKEFQFAVEIEECNDSDKQKRQRRDQNIEVKDNFVVQWRYQVYPNEYEFQFRIDRLNDFQNVSSNMNKKIESAYQQCCQRHKFNKKFFINGSTEPNAFRYLVWGESSNPSSWVQKNVQSQKIRPLTRIVTRPGFENNDFFKEEQLYKIIGLKDSIDLFKEYLREQQEIPQNWKDSVHFEDSLIEKCSEELQNYIQNLRKTKACQIKLQGNEAVIFGFEAETVSKMLKQFKETLIAKQEYPKYWIQTEKLLSGELPCIMQKLSPDSAKYKFVSFYFFQTLPMAQIIQIEAVQNVYAWKMYKAEIENMIILSKQVPLELSLFHGTSATPPQIICSNKEGFDSRYSKNGRWGFGIYFSSTASYSHAYRYTLPNNTFQIIFGRVLVGDTVRLEPDPTLKMPPFNNKTGRLFDSVQGIIDNVQICIVYANKQTYPEYLITYKL